MIKNLVVVGRDCDAWLTALTLQLSLGRSGLQITLVELPSAMPPHEVIPTLPSQRGLHQLLGLSEANVLAAGKGVCSLGYRYSGWSSPGADRGREFFQVYDTAGQAYDGVDFIHYWTRAHQRGLKVPLDEFSLAAAAARRGKLLALSGSAAAFSSARHGYNLSARAYTKAVARLCLESGVRHITAEIESVSTASGGINSLHLKDGRTIEADLYIDASGTGELIDKLESGGLERWDHWFACDRVIVATAPRLRPMAAFNQITAHDSGWVGLYPLASCTGLLAPFCSRRTNADEVLDTATRLSGMNFREPEVKLVNTGMRPKPWVQNCVAVGASAASMDCIESVQPHVLHTALSYLLSLFPVDGDFRLERDRYNAKMAEHVERLRDFQLAHYVLNGRQSPFWQHCANTPLPGALEEKLELFKACGRVSMRECETFQEESWHALFAGSGLIPERYDPLADRMQEDQHIQLFQNMLRFIADQAEQMPDMETLLEMQGVEEKAKRVLSDD